MPESSVEETLLAPSLIIKLNQFNKLHDDEPTEPPPASHFKYRTYPPKTIPVVSSIMGRLNYHAINNVNFEV